MATASHVDENITVSSEAVELLDCFAAELDAVVLSLSKDIARNRLGDPQAGLPIEVEAEDVKAAAMAVLSYLRVQVAEGKPPSYMKEAVDGFERCFQAKCNKE